MLFYAFKMTVSIAFLCKNAAEAIIRRKSLKRLEKLLSSAIPNPFSGL
jgi:hypothetical protein